MINYKTASKSELKAEFQRLAKISGDQTFFTTKEFLHLPKILNAEETPLAVASGQMDGNTWLITLTSQRVIFLDKGILFGVKQVDVNLNNIVSVGGKTGLLMGEILISTSGQNYKIKNVPKTSVIPFTNMVNDYKNKISQTSMTKASSDTIQDFDQTMLKIEKLAKMRDEGILSEEEFQLQKNRLLSV